MVNLQANLPNKKSNAASHKTPLTLLCSAYIYSASHLTYDFTREPTPKT
jgi:hypothetical protein